MCVSEANVSMANAAFLRYGSNAWGHIVLDLSVHLSADYISFPVTCSIQATVCILSECEGQMERTKTRYSSSLDLVRWEKQQRYLLLDPVCIF